MNTDRLGTNADKVTCKGGGCPFRTKTVTPRSPRPYTANLTRLFPSTRLAVGTRLTVAIVKSDTIGRVYEFVMRASRAPRPSPPRCLAPGSSRPGSAC